MKTLAQMKTEYIYHIIKANNGNMTHAAKALGVSRSSLYRWIKGKK